MQLIGEVLKDEQTTPVWARLYEGRPTLVLARDLCHDYSSLRRRLQALSEQLTFEEGLDAATVIGEGLGKDPRRLSQLLAVVEQKKLAVRSVYAGATRLTLVLSPGQLQRAVPALHKAFVESPAAT